MNPIIKMLGTIDLLKTAYAAVNSRIDQVQLAFHLKTAYAAVNQRLDASPRSKNLKTAYAAVNGPLGARVCPSLSKPPMRR